MNDEPDTLDRGGAGPSPPTRPTRVAKRLTRWLTLGLLAYGMACVLTSFFQDRFVYFPSRDLHSTPSDVRLVYEDLWLPASDGVHVSAWYINAPSPRGTIIFCHGNAGNIADRLAQLKLLSGLGYDVLIFDYRGYGRSEGVPSENGTYLDADAAWTYLTQQRGLSPRKIIWFGESLGGAVAIESARRHPPAALVVEATFTSLVDVGRHHYPLLPVGLLLRHRYESVNKVGSIICPKLFIHARDDEIVPYSNGRRLFDAAAEPKQFLETGGGHNTGGFACDDAMLRELDGFLKQAMTAAADGARLAP